MSIACRNGIPRLAGWLYRVSQFMRLKRRGGPGPAAKLLQVFEDPIGGLPLAPQREADDFADFGASSILIVDFRHRAKAEMCARCARPWPKEIFSPGNS